MKHLSQTTRWFVGIIVAVVIMTIIMIAINGNAVPQQPQDHYINDNASADNKVEALKTMTANLLAVEHDNKELQQKVKHLQTQNKKSMDVFKASLSRQMQAALQKIQAENQQKQQVLEEQIKQKEGSQDQGYPINGHVSQQGDFVWISDLSKSAIQNTTDKKHSSLLGIHDGDEADSLLHKSDHQLHHHQRKMSVKPVYTIPVNATLTGATLMTPLVGRVPIDGKLPSPYHFKLVLSAKNLTANGYPMPDIKGAVMSGIVSGDMLGSCARGDIHTITFIFNDGTISTTQAKGQEGSLGYLSSQTGNPCITGTFHSNAALFLGAQMGFAGAEGYANALTDSQYRHSTTSEGISIRTLMGNANKAAMSQGSSAAVEAAQAWWNRRVQNSFDYVYVPNVDPQIKKPMRVVVNITRQIPINYDPTGRKVRYEEALQTHDRELD